MSLALVDFSSLFHRLWNINKVEVEHKLKGAIYRMMEDEIILCLDAPPYARKDKVPSYKANRDVPDPELVGAMRATIERMLNDGFKTARCQGWEADDVIATIVTGNTEDGVTIYGTDKDLLQVCNLTDPFTGEIKDPVSKLEVESEQVVDYLTICGDASDNVKGIEGIGPKTAVKMLSKYKTLDNVIDAVKNDPSSFTEKTAERIIDSLEWIYQSRQLITLRKDLEIEYEKREVVEVEGEILDAEFPEKEPNPEDKTQKTEPQTQHIIKHDDVSYNLSLEPVGIDSAYRLATMIHNSGIYQKYKSPEQVMMIIMRGRALGFDAITSMDIIHSFQSKGGTCVTMAATAMVALAMNSPKCKYIMCTEISNESCTWETHREGYPTKQSRTWTIKDAEIAGLLRKDNWIHNPAAMLSARCSSALCRMTYPDIFLGVYSKEEMV